MQAPSPSCALATELNTICTRFGEILSRTSQIAAIAGVSFYSQVQQELSQQSIQSLLVEEAPVVDSSSARSIKHELRSHHELNDDLPTSSNELQRFWKRTMEDWIGQQLQARGDGPATSAVSPTNFTDSSMQPTNDSKPQLLLDPSNNVTSGSSLLSPHPMDPLNLGFSGTATPPFSPYASPSPHRAMSASPIPGSAPLSPFMPSTSIWYNILSREPTDSLDPSLTITGGASTSPTVSPFVLQPSPFLSPFQFASYYAASMVPVPSQGLAMPMPSSSGSTTPLATQFGSLEVEESYPWSSGNIGYETNHNATTMTPMVQPPTPTPFDNSVSTPDHSESPGARRLSSASLPRLVTTGLSPSTGYTQSPTINISGSLTPDPSSLDDSGHSRTRSLSVSESPNPGGRVSHHRRLSSGSVRYHPFPTPPRGDSSPHLQGLNDHSLSAIMTPSPSSLLSDFTSTTSNSPQSSNESASGAAPQKLVKKRRSRSTDTRSRTTRSVQYDENAVFSTNSVDVFIVHTQTRSKSEVTEQDVLELELDLEPGANAVTSTLYRTVHSRLPYTHEMLEQDCELRKSYHFVSSRAGAITKWIMSYDFGNPKVEEGQRQPRVRIEPVEPLSHCLPSDSILTFVHFPRDSMVVDPTHPIGSSAWWRVQACEGRHEHCPGTGAWTARWDEEGSERRPSRIVQHYAACSLHKDEGDFFCLGKFARAIKRVVPHRTT
ncbi:BZ3500_MvSof-1268-A1-R1_Chr11-2g03370 [Microbotryum saponariae]|uniref:BZ3500_MvSof-1268-A1-R1_Chr11-2g03370 protein n=1 Tax=Microbotryum saponariae TaxID=289078 RepID=A0A2X0LEA5_9BASI|nr:BZ3500_MvSof-1268-A1-R1_Chr11-2g03370 [Microbotryum saponariae]SDA03218.1 BZ3501_MvSof-1269-A2-R1_Chr11g02941 [Microbotryum saponariae]